MIKIKKTRKKRVIIVKTFFWLLKTGVFVGILGLLLGIFIFIYYTRDLPRPEKFTQKEFIQSTKIYDRNGDVLLYDIHGEEKREIVPLSEVPENLKRAVMATEDDKFYQHWGVDFAGILRAVWVNIREGELAQGGSTITQQLIRSSFLTRKKTIERKVKELILTLELERRYSKDQILEWYLNQTPLGSNSYGVEAASETYFDKSVSDISLAESAVLASLIKAPSYFSPYGQNKDELLTRKDYVIDRMESLGYITPKEAKEAKEEKIIFAKIKTPIKAPHFVLYIKKQLEEKYGKEFLKSQGLEIYTTLDWSLQQKAQETIQEYSEDLKLLKANNSALVSINPNTGEVLAMVGSKDYFGDPYPDGCVQNKDQKCLFEPKFNVATLGKRQPGSAFKPFVYAAAFEKGYTPQSLLFDVKTEFNPNCNKDTTQEETESGLKCYHPKNYDQLFRGVISLRSSLAQSINLTSVKLLYLIGVQNTIDFASNLGITTLTDPSRYGLSLVLGGGEVKLIDMVSSYGVFATGGYRIPPVTILKIKNSDGNIIEQNNKEKKRVLNTQTANLINDVLSDNKARAPMFGYNSALHFKDYDVAAKTGTTQYYNDAWTVGYNPSIVTGVWVGNNDNSPMVQKPSIRLAGLVWRDFMDKALEMFPDKKFQLINPPSLIKNQENKFMINGLVNKKEPHTILHYIKKEEPLGEIPQNPEELDEQYLHWEEGLKNWLENHSLD